jgi:hypothetical protein
VRGAISEPRLILPALHGKKKANTLAGNGSKFKAKTNRAA